MKKILKIMLSVITALCIAALLPMLTVKTQAAEKTAGEQQLEALNTYLNALIAQGGSKEDIDFAKTCIETVKAQIANAATASQTAALNAGAVLTPEQQISAALEARKQAEALADAQVKELAKVVTQPAQAAGVIFVGDSRTVEMHNVVSETGVTFIAENSRGYKWFTENAIPRVDNIVGKGSHVVINLGVNDLGNADKYIATVNNKALEWRAKGAKVYFCTVNPVWENPYSTEEGVKIFNNKLAAGLIGVNLIDTHTFLETNGYVLRDGLHYNAPTTLALYTYIMSRLG